MARRGRARGRGGAAGRVATARKEALTGWLPDRRRPARPGCWPSGAGVRRAATVAVLVALNLLVWAFFARLGRRGLHRCVVEPAGRARSCTRCCSGRTETVSDYLELLPAVDIADGQAVQLVQGVAGSEKRFGDPVEAALRWQEAGAEWIHLVDLDAAFGRGHNRELQARIVGTLDIEVEMSGGIRDDESLEAAMATGCRRVNIGTAALEQPEWCAARDRRARRPGRRRPRRPRPHPRRPRLDPRGRRPLRGAGPARRRGLRPLRRHRRQQGRHARRAPTSSCCATSAPPPTARSSPPAGSPRSTTSRR